MSRKNKRVGEVWGAPVSGHSTGLNKALSNMGSEADGRGVLGLGMEQIRKEEESLRLMRFAFVFISREERERASRTLNQELNVEE